MTLSRASILAATDLEFRQVDVPEWGGSVWVRGLTGRERDRFELLMLPLAEGKTSDLSFRAEVAAMGCVDWDGDSAPTTMPSPLFQPADVKQLGQKSAAALSRLVASILELSGLTAPGVTTEAPAPGEGQSVGSGSD